MKTDIVQMMPEQYRRFVAVQYLNASTYLYEGLKRLQGNNDFHFVVSMRSFIEYTRRGIWFLAWARDEQVRAVSKLTFQKPGSPSVAKMDIMINEALGRGKVSSLMSPVLGIGNEPFLDCLHALTHGNPISVRMVSFGVGTLFQTDMLLVRAETDLNLFRILLYRHMLGENLDDIWKMLAAIHNQPEPMRINVRIAAKELKQKNITLP
jgi:hypothetical protein